MHARRALYLLSASPSPYPGFYCDLCKGWVWGMVYHVSSSHWGYFIFSAPSLCPCVCSVDGNLKVSWCVMLTLGTLVWLPAHHRL